FYSRTIRGAERNYCVYDLEIMAAVETIAFFQEFLENRFFTLVCDNKAMSYLMSKKNLCGRIARHAMFLANFNFKIVLVKSHENTIADFISRHASDKPLVKPAPRRSVRVNAVIKAKPEDHDLYQMLRKAQQNDEVISELSKNIKKGIANERHFIEANGIVFKRNGDHFLPYVPKEMINEILHNYHQSVCGAHLGIDRTLKTVGSRFYWPNLYNDTKE